jgi:ribosomal protein L7/L12
MPGQCRGCGQIASLVSDMLCYGCHEERYRQRCIDERRHLELLEALKTPAQRRAEAREQQRRDAEAAQRKYERFRLFKIKIQDVRTSNCAREGAAAEAMYAINKIRAGEEIYLAGTYCVKLDPKHNAEDKTILILSWLYIPSDYMRYYKSKIELCLNSGNSIPNLLTNLVNGDVFYKFEISNKNQFDWLKNKLFTLEDEYRMFCVCEVLFENIIDQESSVDAGARISQRTSEPIQSPPHETIGSTNLAAEKFSIFLQGDVVVDKKISVIAVIREINKMGLKDAKDFVEKKGLRLVEKNLSKQDADEMKRKIEVVGGSILIFDQAEICR